MMTANPYPSQAQSDNAELEKQVNSLLNNMSLEQQVGQLFMVSFSGPGVNDTARQFLSTMQPGGLALFASNGISPQDVTRAVNTVQDIATKNGAQIPILVGVDHEGGPVTRLTRGFTALPWGAALGAMPPDDAYKVGTLAGDELSAVGIHINFAPVADIRSDATMHFMERRVFGTDPETVGTAVSAYLKGLQAHGVVGVLKHFPGHGAASDSHVDLPTVKADKTEIESNELIPFKMGIENGVDGVMVGHLSYPAIDANVNEPASLSSIFVSDILRGELGYKGVAMTDAMDMGAIAEHYTRQEAALAAIQAGIDMITSGPNMSLTDQLAMKQAIVDAVKAGKIPASRITESVRRILMLKARYGVLAWTPLDPATADDRVDTKAHQAIVDDIYLDTIAFAHDANHVLPITPPSKTIGIVYPGNFTAIPRECSALDPKAKLYAYSLDPSGSEFGIVKNMGRDLDLIVIFTYNISEHPGQAPLVNMIPPEKAVVVAMQNPFDIEQGIDPGGYITAFNTSPGAYKATCQVLFGQHPALGKWLVKGVAGK